MIIELFYCDLKGLERILNLEKNIDKIQYNIFDYLNNNKIKYKVVK